jgi:ABC-2 type transport system ATP-binding protein
MTKDDRPRAISVRGLTKRYRDVTAVDDLSFDVEAGTITGFLGPNGAGKTTTLRMILGLVRPTHGTSLIHGVEYAALDRPARHVGAVLDAAGFHPGRTARDHLRIVAGPYGIPIERVDEVLAEVDLADASRRRVGGFSLGMRQRLGLAAALLADPGILVLDEPTNGLDPAGVHWLRGLLRQRVDRGDTVLVSSHLLAELALYADHIVIIKAGRLVTQGSVADLTAAGAGLVRLRTPQAGQLRDVLAAAGLDAEVPEPDLVVVRGGSSPQIGELVAAAGVVVLEMREERANLEDTFLSLTRADGSR